MIEIKVKDLCKVGYYGKKVHIKYPVPDTGYIKLTYCGLEWNNDEFEYQLLGLTEKDNELCKKCLSEYKRRHIS